MKNKLCNYPRLLEINARVWIKRFGDKTNLSMVPDSQFELWKEMGIDMIWLMGIWVNNKEVIEEYCFEPESDSRL